MANSRISFRLMTNVSYDVLAPGQLVVGHIEELGFFPGQELAHVVLEPEDLRGIASKIDWIRGAKREKENPQIDECAVGYCHHDEHHR